MRFKYFDHTADCKFQSYGKTLEEVFKNAALAMMNHLTPVDEIKPVEERKIEAKSKRLDTLMYDFLEEFIFLIDTDGLIFGKVEVSIKKEGEEYHLQATIKGDSYKNYETHGDIKAITYNDMYIREEKDGWVAQVVVDI